MQITGMEAILGMHLMLTVANQRSHWRTGRVHTDLGSFKKVVLAQNAEPEQFWPDKTDLTSS